VFDLPATSTRRAGHSECKVIAIEIDDVKIVHAVVIIVGRLDHLCSVSDKLGVNAIDVVDKHTDTAIAGQSGSRGVRRAASR
jgi:hypothetical protein